jgi:anti-sigma factor RsiW
MSGHVFPFTAHAHDEAQRLLPWLANGTLDADERERVEQHLEACSECRGDLRELEVLRSASHDAAGHVGDADAGWRRMQRSLAAAGKTERSARWSPWPSAWHGAPRWIGWAIATQMALLVAFGTLAWWSNEPRPAMYHTLGAGPSSASAASGNLVIVFDPQLGEGQMRRLLAASDARIVDGPNEAGAYVLAVPPAREHSVRDALRAAPGVTMVESLGDRASR